jgi:hypothetical protein
MFIVNTDSSGSAKASRNSEGWRGSDLRSSVNAIRQLTAGNKHWLLGNQRASIISPHLQKWKCVNALQMGMYYEAVRHKAQRRCTHFHLLASFALRPPYVQGNALNMPLGELQSRPKCCSEGKNFYPGLESKSDRPAHNQSVYYVSCPTTANFVVGKTDRSVIVVLSFSFV